VLNPGESIASETLMIAVGDDPVALADLYAKETAWRMQARVPKQVPTGWCSWYFFYNKVTEQDVLANLETLRTGPYKVDYVQIDDGFQSATGDWLIPNEKFPRGMQPVAEEIAAAGFRPGLWLAPFTVNTGSRLFKEHPEWMLHDAEGNIIVRDIWLGPCAGLDCTHPGAEEWLRHLIRTTVHEWGYTFLKLDALFCATYEGARHHRPNTTTAMNLRRGLEIIREAAGNETFILGCSCPFGPAVGLVDAMRVGPDVDAVWFKDQYQPSAKHALRMSLQRNWMHRRFWLNDPDCLTVRDQDSEVSPGTLTLDEAQFLATGIALSGGLTVLSDDLTALSPARRAIALRVLQPTGRAAWPLDLVERETPTLWSLPLGRGRLAVAALNWDDAPLDATVTWQRLGIQGPHFAREQWTETDLGQIEGAVRFTAVPPHGAQVVVLDPRSPVRATRRLLPV
jgi:alpha-galactosidase